MKPSLLIADFTGVYAEEGFLQKLQERGVPYRRVRLGDIEGTTCYCDPDAEAEISRRLIPEPEERMRWIDSGDYHYVTKILAAREQSPFTLVLVDNHPDDQAPAFGGVLSCGSWVRDLREASPVLEEVWTLGPDHRIRNASGTVDRELDAGIDDLLEAVAGKRVYLSIDKDVLDRAWSRTDWSQGTYSPAQLKGWLDGLLRQDIVAVDLCGELAPEKGATPEDLRINGELNVELQESVSGPVDLSPWMGADSVYTFTVKDVTFTLAPVKAGTFAMGETLDMGRFRTPALHQVILDGYAIGTTEVTQALWKAVMGSNPSPKDVPTAPVTMVSYGDAQKFLQKLSKATGVPFRLPTEAEWEYAARQREGMAGGAWEWCSDRWTDDLGALLTVNPQGPEDGAEYALRGGSALEKNNKAITRKPMAPTTKAGDVGLRLAVSTGEAFPQELYEVLVENKVPRERYKITELKPETFTVNGVNFEMRSTR